MTSIPLIRKTTNGTSNTSLGINSLNNNTGIGNIGIGKSSLQNNSTGNYNIGFGNNTLNANISGNYNIAFGQDTLKNNTGSYNIAIGKNALENNLNGSDNIAIGSFALNKNIGNNNIAIGHYALNNNSDGIFNIAIGNNAGRYYNGSYNIFIGNDTGPTSTIYSGSYNIYLGNKAGFANAADYSYSISIGAGSFNTSNFQIKLGNASADTYYYGTAVSLSDRRDKTNISDCLLGIDYINQLRPVDYIFDYRESYIDKLNPPVGDLVKLELVKDGTKKRNRFHHGFIAQEVEETGHPVGVYNSKDTGGQDEYGIDYLQFIAPLCKAIQELSARNKLLKERITSLELQL